MLHLQRSVPFVDSVFRIIDGETEYDESINLLIRAEQSSGIRIIIPALGGVRYMPEEKFSSLMKVIFMSLWTPLTLCCRLHGMMI